VKILQKVLGGYFLTHTVDIGNMYLQTKNELFKSQLSKVRSLQTDTQKDAIEHTAAFAGI